MEGKRGVATLQRRKEGTGASHGLAPRGQSGSPRPFPPIRRRNRPRMEGASLRCSVPSCADYCCFRKHPDSLPITCLHSPPIDSNWSWRTELDCSSGWLCPIASLSLLDRHFALGAWHGFTFSLTLLLSSVLPRAKTYGRPNVSTLFHSILNPLALYILLYSPTRTHCLFVVLGIPTSNTSLHIIRPTSIASKNRPDWLGPFLHEASSTRNLTSTH